MNDFVKRSDERLAQSEKLALLEMRAGVPLRLSMDLLDREHELNMQIHELFDEKA